MEKKQSYEDYLERILLLKEIQGTVKSIDIANSMKFSRASVSIALKKLESDGYVTVNPEHFYIELTDKGLAVAEKIIHRHRLFTKFFISLGIDPEVAEDDACRIEHDLSDDTFNKLEEFIKQHAEF